MIKVDHDLNVIDRGSTTYGLNMAGFVLHSTIHEARPDVNAVIHVHTAAAAGISSVKSGLLPLSQEALIIGDVGYHNYRGVLIDDEMRKIIAKDLGSHNVLILRNHGVAICGATLEEAYLRLINFMVT